MFIDRFGYSLDPRQDEIDREGWELFGNDDPVETETDQIVYPIKLEELE